MENRDGASRVSSVTGEILMAGGNSLASEQRACEAGSFPSCVHNVCQEEALEVSVEQMNSSSGR